ncbi:hypothetical protein ACQKWADRAFT_293205 [Trichoderma austrokoningii]
MDEFHDFVMSYPRPFPAPHIESHLELLDEATRIQRQLEAWTNRPILSEFDLLELGVIRCNGIDIDDEISPIMDHSIRYFHPDTPHVAARRAQRWNDLGAWPSLDEKYPQTFGFWRGDPVPTNLSLMDGITQTVVKCLRLTDWEAHADSPQRPFGPQDPDHRRWVRTSLPPRTNMATSTVARLHDNLYHRFRIHDWRVSLSRGNSDERENTRIPQSIAVVSDTISPPDDRYLRSELLQGVMILRECMEQLCWAHHFTLPVGASTNL